MRLDSLRPPPTYVAPASISNYPREAFVEEPYSKKLGKMEEKFDVSCFELTLEQRLVIFLKIGYFCLVGY